MKNILTYLFIILSASLAAQSIVWGNDSTILGLWQEGQFVDGNSEILYSSQGNIIFDGNTTDIDDMVWAYDGIGFFEKKKGEVYNPAQELVLHIKKGEVYHKTYLSNYMLLRIQKTEDFIVFYSALNDSLLAFSEDITLGNTALLSITHFLVEKHDLIAQLSQLQSSTTSSTGNGEILGMMEPRYGGGNVWYWDGKYLFPDFPDEKYVWEFDGSTLKPIFYPRQQEEWSWDGETLSPYWGGNPQMDWRWRGDILSQVWDSNYQNEYVFDGEVARKRFGAFGEQEWLVTGEIPKPLMAIILLGIVYR